MSGNNKIIVWMQVSLDGKASGPGGAFDWPLVQGDLWTHFVEGLRGAGQFCYGASVYQQMAAYWPTADEEPDADPRQIAYSKLWKPMPKLVFSRTLTTSDWNTTVSADVDMIRDYASKADGHTYVFGGPTIVGDLIGRDLIDEYQLFVHPVVLGGGAPLFPALDDRQPVELVESRVYDGRVVSMHYARRR